jgi:hypothetical protein
MSIETLARSVALSGQQTGRQKKVHRKKTVFYLTVAACTHILKLHTIPALKGIQSRNWRTSKISEQRIEGSQDRGKRKGK